MLNFEYIEDCFPDHGALCATDDRITVSAQWLHDFAHNVAKRERGECVSELMAMHKQANGQHNYHHVAANKLNSNAELCGVRSTSERAPG